MNYHLFPWFALAAIGCQAPSSIAFAPPSSLQHQQVHQQESTITTTQIWSTPDGSFDNDELSKLIGKRNQIKKNMKKEEPPKEPELPEDLQDFDLGTLKTARPDRKSKNANEEAAEAAAAARRNSGADEAVLSIDYKAEYEDENDFHVPNRLGWSTAGWGEANKGFISQGKLTKRMIKAGMYVPGDCQMVYNKLVEGGINLIETSSVYGKAYRKQKLSAEDILGQSVAEYQADQNLPLIVESLPVSWLPPRGKSMQSTVDESCQRLKLDLVDIVQASKRIPLLSPFIANGLLSVAEAGSCTYVGVSGILQRSSLKRFADAVEKKGGILTSNSFEFSLTNLKNEAMIEHCKELGVLPLILNPLDGGLASGVYTASNPSGGGTGGARFKFETLEKLQPLHSVLETVAQRVQTRVKRELRDMQDRFRSRYGPPVRY